MVVASVPGNPAAVLGWLHPVLPGSETLSCRCRRCIAPLVDIGEMGKVVAAHAEQSIDRVAGAYSLVAVVKPRGFILP